jgi:hypothetical protein
MKEEANTHSDVNASHFVCIYSAMKEEADTHSDVNTSRFVCIYYFPFIDSFAYL